MERRWLWAGALVALGGMLLAGQPAPAQGRTQSGEEQEITVDQLNQQVQLSDAQKAQIQGINQQRRTDIQNVQQDTSLTPQQKAEKIRQINRNANLQVQSTLTPEQRQRWQARRRDVRQDTRDLRQDRQQLKQDQDQLERDKQKLREDLKNPNRDPNQIKRDREQVKQDQQKINKQRREARRDKRDLQRDRRRPVPKRRG